MLLKTHKRWLLRIMCWSLLLAIFPIQAEPLIAVITSADDSKALKLQSNQLSLIYWRKKLYDKAGNTIHPANLHAEHPLRLLFSKQVLNSKPKAQVDYWNGLYFHGVLPPRTLQSEEAMLRYVSDTYYAIGYVNACSLDSRVQVLLWLDADSIYSEPPPSLGCPSN